MGETGAAAQAYSNRTGGLRWVTPEVAYDGFRRYMRIHNTLQRYGPPVTQPTLGQWYDITYGVLDFLVLNRKHWATDATEEGRRLQRQHLAFTLFVPASRADRAHTAIKLLTDHGTFDRPGLNNEDKLYAADAIRPFVRFHTQKTQRLQEALDQLAVFRLFVREPGRNVLTRKVVDELHEWLVDKMPGMGMKAAAHFMRNTGLWTEDYGRAIIDVHIHKALEALNCKHGDGKTTTAAYREAEESFQRFAQVVNIPTLLLDAYLWCAYSGNWELETADFGNFK